MTARTQACVELLQPRDLTSLIPGITVEDAGHVPRPDWSLISDFINPSHFLRYYIPAWSKLARQLPQCRLQWNSLHSSYSSRILVTSYYSIPH